MMGLTASLWDGRDVDPQVLIKAFGLTVMQAPSGPAWRLTHIGYGHGRPQLRVQYLGKAQSGTTWLSVANLVLYTPANNGESTLDVNAGSYYSPANGQPGPWTVDPDGPSDVVRGVGMAIGIQPQPTVAEDNRYLMPLLSFEWQDNAPPPPQPTPSPGIKAHLDAAMAELAAARALLL